jgi:UrcA family protein
MKYRSASLATIFAAGATLLSAAAYGQAMEVVTVEAVREIVVGKSQIGAPIKELSIRARVTFADLDLTTAAGAAALQKRVEDTAQSSCKEIKVDVPAEGSSHEQCVKDALAGAQPQIDRAVAEAKAAKQ